MTTAFTLSAKKRQDIGKGASRRLRRQAGLVPAIIYGADKNVTMIHLEHRNVIKSLENEAFYTQIITIDVEGQKEQVILKDLQRHCFKPLVLHMDFLRIREGEKMLVHVPIHFTGEDLAPGVKTHGGMVAHMITHIDINCLPTDIPEYIEVDLSTLDMDEVLHLSQVALPANLSFAALEHKNDLAIASIHKPRGAAQLEDQEIPVQEVPEEPASDNDKKKGDKK